MPVFFIHSSAVAAGSIEITGELAHHLRNVLRLRPGETITLVDEARQRYRAVTDSLSARSIVARIEGAPQPPPATGPEITLFPALLKGKKMDWLIQKATELGVHAIAPVISERTMARPETERGADRWRRIALEAAQQSSRLDVPQIAPPIPLEALLAAPPAGDAGLILWERERRPLRDVLQGLPRRPRLSVIIGPEGGLATQEVEHAIAAGYRPGSLGAPILRAETASLAALAMLLYEFGPNVSDWN